jgi:hypothetical protein
MAAFGFTTDYTNVLTAGISDWKIFSGKAGEVGFVSLLPLAEGTVVLKTNSTADTRKRTRPFGAGVEARAKILGTEKTTCLQKLHLLTGYMNTHRIAMTNGKYFRGEMGTFWKFVCDGGYEANRFVEIGADLGMLLSHASLTDIDDTLTAGMAAASDAADYLYGFAPGTIYPAGFSNLETRNAGETNWETVGAFRNPSLTAELGVTKDSKMRSIGYMVTVNIGFDMMQADEELALLDSFAAGEPDFRATLADGTIFTFADNVGLSFEHHNDKDMDDIAYTKVSATGAMTPAQFVAVIS